MSENTTEETLEEVSPLAVMIEETGGDLDLVWQRITGGLEFLILRAVMDGPFYMQSEAGNALIVFASDDEAQELFKNLPEHYKNFEDPLDSAEVITDRDPGDEQDEPSPESE
jgi:hypothetical protein